MGGLGGGGFYGSCVGESCLLLSFVGKESFYGKGSFKDIVFFIVRRSFRRRDV